MFDAITGPNFIAPTAPVGDSSNRVADTAFAAAAAAAAITAAGTWTSYTPTLTSFTGAFTTASASARYAVLGKIVFISVEVVVTTIGTGSFPVFTLPVTPVDYTKVVFNGYEGALTGYSMNGRITGVGATTILISRYDNAIPTASGSRFEVSSVYEAL